MRFAFARMKISEDSIIISSAFHVFNYKQAEIIERRLCDINFWKKRAEERARIEFDYFHRLNEWCNSFQRRDSNQGDTETDKNTANLLLEHDATESCTRLQLAHETAKMFDRFSEDLKNEGVWSRSPAYTSNVKSFKSALKIYRRTSKETDKAKQNYESKMQKLIDYDAAPRQRLRNVSRLTASVDIAKKIFEYYLQKEATTRDHLMQISVELRRIWEKETAKNLAMIVEKWKKCITSVRDIREKLNSAAIEDISPFVLCDGAIAIQLEVQAAADRLSVSLQMPIQDIEDESKPPTRAPSQISVLGSICTERNSVVYGSETESIDYEELSENDTNQKKICFLPSQDFGKYRNNGWLHGLQDDETSGKRDTQPIKLFGCKVKVVKDYKKNNLREISLKTDQEIRQMFPPNETGYAFGYKRNKFRKKCFGYFPGSHVEDI